MVSTLVQIVTSPLVVLTLISSCLIIYFTARYCVRSTLQWGYENAFLDHVEELVLREQERTNEPIRTIPLTFRRQEAEDLFALCLASRSRLKPGYNSYRAHLRENPPTVQENLIRLQWIMERSEPLGLLRSEMIRCDSDHALVEGGDGYSAYILTRDYAELRRNHNARTTFNIDSKFRYTQETAERPRDEGVELMPVATDQPVHDRNTRNNLPSPSV